MSDNQFTAQKIMEKVQQDAFDHNTILRKRIVSQALDNSRATNQTIIDLLQLVENLTARVFVLEEKLFKVNEKKG